MDYEFEAKQNGYRVPAWNFVDRMCSTPRGLRRVAILDTIKGLEARHLVRLGYRPENILVVNRSTGELAEMTKRLRAAGIDGVRTKAGEFTEVLLGWKERLHVISFDTTSNLMAEEFYRLPGVVDVHRPECVSGVMLAGREDGLLSGVFRRVSAGFMCPHRDSLNNDANPMHFARVADLAVRVGGAAKPRWGTYVSTSGQAMIWWVFDVTDRSVGVGGGEIFLRLHRAAKAENRRRRATQRAEAEPS